MTSEHKWDGLFIYFFYSSIYVIFVDYLAVTLTTDNSNITDNNSNDNYGNNNAKNNSNNTKIEQHQPNIMKTIFIKKKLTNITANDNNENQIHNPSTHLNTT